MFDLDNKTVLDLISEKDNKIYNQLTKKLSAQWNLELSVKIEKSNCSQTLIESSFPNEASNDEEEVYTFFYI